MGPVLWEQPLPQPRAMSWSFSVQEAQRTQLALLVPEDLGFFNFKDIYAKILKAALRAVEFNSHSPASPKVLKILT